MKEINLLACTKLMEIPDFSKASKLEHVLLYWCSNLCCIHPSLLHLDTLVELDVFKCEKFTSLKSDKHLKSSEMISIDGGTSLKKFSLSSTKIEELYFCEMKIETFPSSLGCCKNLKVLKFNGTLKEIPSKISKFTSLKCLHIFGARGFDSSKLSIFFDALHPLKSYI